MIARPDPRHCQVVDDLPFREKVDLIVQIERQVRDSIDLHLFGAKSLADVRPTNFFRYACALTASQSSDEPNAEAPTHPLECRERSGRLDNQQKTYPHSNRAGCSSRQGDRGAGLEAEGLVGTRKLPQSERSDLSMRSVR